MFARAGFDRRCRAICRAWIGHRGAGWVRPSTLVRFRTSGEFAWWGAGGISWPEHCIVFSLRDVMPVDLQESRLRLPRSPLPEHTKETT